MFLFLGFVLSFSLWYVFLPEEAVDKVFEVQTKTIAEINSPVAGNAYNISSTLMKIFTNNMRVLVFCLIFAFFYGFGAIFILTWNASIIGAAVGDFARSQVAALATILSLWTFF